MKQESEVPNSNKRKTSTLMALSSAAVFSIYAAGYVRTRSAAEEIAAAELHRRPVDSEGRRVGQPVPSPLTSSTSVTQAAPTPARETPPSAASPAVTAPARRQIADASSKTTSVPGSPDPKASSSAARAAAPAVPGLPASAAPVSAPLPGIQSSVPPAPQEIAAAVNVSLQTPPSVASQLKDGTYLGWGSCRHGDIQASVTIAGGKITVATIADCRTRYSCGWLDGVVPQVVARQSPNIDYVSGATQSVDAFYYAVVDALAKAK